jgi:Holliday junction resolvasome RuvABC endonuclease subunit
MKNEDIIYRVISFDPGANLGITVSEGDMGLTKLKPIHSETLDLNKLVKHRYSEIADTYGARFARIFALRDAMKDIFNRWQPDFLTHENAFMMMTRVTAGITLAEYVLIIRIMAYEYDPIMPIYGYSPFEIKSAVKLKGKLTGNKHLVAEALPKLQDLDLSSVDISQMDEHSIDSIAIGYCFMSKNRKGK